MSTATLHIEPALAQWPSQNLVPIHYQIYGCALHTAPIIVVNHALTGNSQLNGPNGWWKEIVGDHLVLDTQIYTLICMNVPGNGFLAADQELKAYEQTSTQQVAILFWEVLNQLGVQKLYALIGGSIGGAIGWEMLFLAPDRVEHFFPIACHYQASDWILAQTHVQKSILNNSTHPIQDARQHAMLLYRTPSSLREKFNRKKNNQTQQYEVQEWLDYHGNALHQRFQLHAYRLMNHLLSTIGQSIDAVSFDHFLKENKAVIHIIAITSDAMFIEEDQFQTYQLLLENNQEAFYSNIDSIHGHDAFLIETVELQKIIQSYF